MGSYFIVSSHRLSWYQSPVPAVVKAAAGSFGHLGREQFFVFGSLVEALLSCPRTSLLLTLSDPGRARCVT